MDLADALLEQADQLLAIDRRRPKQVSLRRAISATYYALFHRLVARATDGYVGGASAGRAIRDHVSRWFTHRRMVDVATAFAQPLALKRTHPLRPLLVDDGAKPPSIRVPADLVDVAQAFVTLQEARHAADYDLSVWYSRTNARGLVGRGQHAFAAIDRLSADPMFGLFLLLLLTGDSIAVTR